jgi:hypothetical protein
MNLSLKLFESISFFGKTIINNNYNNLTLSSEDAIKTVLVLNGKMSLEEAGFTKPDTPLIKVPIPAENLPNYENTDIHSN